MLQLKPPTRGDWVSTCLNDLKQLKITETFDQIKNMKLVKFHKIIKSRITEAALNYLTGKQRTTSGEVKYEELRFSEYLSPNNTGLTIEHKRKMFSVLNKMVNISANFPSNSKN